MRNFYIGHVIRQTLGLMGRTAQNSARRVDKWVTYRPVKVAQAHNLNLQTLSQREQTQHIQVIDLLPVKPPRSARAHPVSI
jgi:hypothetical protein